MFKTRNTMKPWKKISILYVVLSPILANSNKNSVSNDLQDSLDLQDASMLEQLGDMIKNQTPTKKMNVMCPDSVLRFSGRDDVKFLLYNNRHLSGIDISKNIANMLIPKAPIKFVIHGFSNGGNSIMVQLVKNAFMTRMQNYNVIVVDWSKGSGAWNSNYFICNITTRIVPLVANAVADFTIDLIHQQHVNILHVNLIGHSLGAHISGLAGKQLINHGYKLPVIVGLDPALPGYKDMEASKRLCSSDAAYVEVIHTNSGVFGFRKPIGTADFYPNFHKFLSRMPGCTTLGCSHARSFRYFAESIRFPFGFKARKCDSYFTLESGSCNKGFSYMGGNDIRVGKAVGIFVLETNNDSPFRKSKTI